MMTYIVVVLILFLIPGPAVILTVTQSLRGGKKAGVLTGVGIAIGDLIHTLASVLGLSAILMTSALAFELIKYLGAAYLFILGVNALIKKLQPTHTFSMKNDTSSSVVSFRQAVLIELLNPKTALFFLAFLPQFVEEDGTSIVAQLLLLGLIFVIMSILYTSLLAIIVSSIGSNIFQRKPTLFPWLDKVAGLVYIGLGLKLIFES